MKRDRRTLEEALPPADGGDKPQAIKREQRGPIRDALRSLKPALWVCAAIAAIIVLSVYGPTSCGSPCKYDAAGNEYRPYWDD